MRYSVYLPQEILEIIIPEGEHRDWRHIRSIISLPCLLSVRGTAQSVSHAWTSGKWLRASGDTVDTDVVNELRISLLGMVNGWMLLVLVKREPTTVQSVSVGWMAGFVICYLRRSYAGQWIMFVIMQQSHFFTNKDTLKLGHIGNWGHWFQLWHSKNISEAVWRTFG